MGSGKSAHLLQVAHNYEQEGFKIIKMKPSFDTRELDIIYSRIGISKPCDLVFTNEDDLFNIVKSKLKDGEIEAVLVDEVNFITEEQAIQLVRISAQLDITVIAYGLKASYTGVGFSGMNRLMSMAHKIEEPNKIVDRTGKKCTMHLRSINGKYVFDGEACIVGDIIGEEKYESCTAERWFYEYDKWLESKEE